ncbi:MAG: hypothetical protein IT373_02000 [Polyangiaceae bacterium]|nr:hypothetical protein [Polyangiaceae bacterium]
MIDFFQEGGWGMWPILIVGLVLVGVAVRFAVDREPVRLRVIVALGVTLVVLAAHATWMDLGTVFWALGDGNRFPAEDVPQVLLQGLKESTRPGTLGLGLLAIALVIVAIGVYREGRRELRAARG